MQFMLTAYDGTDAGALQRRLAVRDQHIKLGDELLAQGKMLFGTAILNENDQMIGSMIVVDFPTREDVDEWLKIEPYITGRVWERYEIVSVRVGPSFVGLHK